MTEIDYETLIRLDGRVFVVFGTGTGIGGETVRALKTLGATVACVDLDEATAAAAAGDEGLAIAADVSQPGAIQRALNAVVDRWGRLDGVIDVIGAALFKTFADTSDQEWDRQVDLVIRHAFRILRASTPLLRESGGGTLGFIASIAGLNAAASHGTYGMFKAAMMSMVRSAAVELGPSGIRVNCVAPGATNTPRLLATQTPEMRDVAIRSTPLRKAAEPSDIAAALAFLSSPMAGHITGQTVVIDGGVSLMNWRELTDVGSPDVSP
jgi:NAD(P)-dependent dehydrogenase (short-subunit alcohol dehydrogenase family)